MSRFRFLLILAALLSIAWPAAAQKSGKKEAPKVAAPAAFSEDKGRFRVVVDGQPAGTEDFSITRSGSDWMARGTVEIPAEGGGVSKLSGRLRFAADGSPIQYEYDWSPHGGKKIAANITFQDGTARVESQMEGTQSFVQEFKFDTPRVAILDNNLYHQYAILARLYDWKKKGSQSIPVLIPQDQTPGTISVEWVGPQEVGGIKADVLRVHSADLEIDVYYDSARRVVRLAVPASKAEVLREP